MAGSGPSSLVDRGSSYGHSLDTTLDTTLSDCELHSSGVMSRAMDSGTANNEALSQQQITPEHLPSSPLPQYQPDPSAELKIVKFQLQAASNSNCSDDIVTTNPFFINVPGYRVHAEKISPLPSPLPSPSPSPTLESVAAQSASPLVPPLAQSDQANQISQNDQEESDFDEWEKNIMAKIDQIHISASSSSSIPDNRTATTSKKPLSEIEERLAILGPSVQESLEIDIDLHPITESVAEEHNQHDNEEEDHST